MPRASPRTVKRRCTPANSASAVRTTGSGISISSATAMTASAFSALCAPTICTVNSPSASSRRKAWKRVENPSSVTPSSR